MIKHMLTRLFLLVVVAAACGTTEPSVPVTYNLAATCDTTVVCTCCTPAVCDTTTVATPFAGTLVVSRLDHIPVATLDAPELFATWGTRADGSSRNANTIIMRFCMINSCGPYLTLTGTVTSDSIYGQARYVRPGGSSSSWKSGTFVARRD